MSGRNAWDSRTFRKAITKAGKIVTCSWGVVGLRNKATNKFETVAIFHDQEHDQFGFAYAFENMEQVAYFCRDLMTMQERIDKGEMDGPDMNLFNVNKPEGEE